MTCAVLDPIGDALRGAELAFESALRQELAGVRRLRIAGASVRMRFAGPVASILDRAFGHLATPEDDSVDDLAITILVGVSPPGSVRDRCANYGDGSLVLVDGERCVQWIPSLAAVPAWASASPLRAVLGRFLARRGRYLVHAAAIGTPDAAILVAAKGGSGKSTTALACLDAGLAIAGDDFVVLEPGARVAHSLLATARLDPAHVARFSRLAHLVRHDESGDKSVVALFPGAGARLALALPLRAIVVPRLALDERASTVAPISRMAALLALAPSTLFLVPGAGRETLDALQALVATLPVYALRIGSDVGDISRAIAALLAELSRG